METFYSLYSFILNAFNCTYVLMGFSLLVTPIYYLLFLRK